MSNALTDKLRAFAVLSDQDILLLEAECARFTDVPAQHDLIREGDVPGPLLVMLSGWACRYKLLPEGTRQITSFLMPGDCCDMHTAVLEVMDHTISTLTQARVAAIARWRFDELIDTRPHLLKAFWWAQLVDECTLRAWIVSMGRRGSVEQVAHLMCELWVRARTIGLIHDNELELPLTQIVLADALGLTPVHVSRVLRKLRLAGVMKFGTGTLVIADIAELARVAGFDANYLHRKVTIR